MSWITHYKKHHTENKSTEQSEKDAVFEALVKKASSGDRVALCDLCENIAKGVLFRVTHILGNITDAEDVSQEVLFRVCEGIRDLRNPKVFKVWLSRIIRNESYRFLDKYKKSGVSLNIDDYIEILYEDRADFIPPECVEQSDSQRIIMGVLATLTPRQRQAVILRYYDGLSVTEVAEVMQVTKQSISESLALSREKIRIELERSQPSDVSSAVPVGLLMTNVLNQKAALFARYTAEWVAHAVSRCGYHIATGLAVSATAYSALSASSIFWWIIGGFSVIFTVAAIVLGIALYGTPREALPRSTDIEDLVVFSGGIDYGGHTVYVNPRQAQPMTVSEGGSVTALQWWITAAGSADILFQGDGGVVDDALVYLLESGADGEYMLYFRLEDNMRTSYRLSSNFYILASAELPFEAGAENVYATRFRSAAYC